MPTAERFQTTVTLAHWPFCPACGRPLTPGGVTFIHGYAFCPPCAERAVDAIRVSLHVLREPVMHRYTVLESGLYWYANHDGGTRGVDALSLYRRLTGKSCLIDWHTHTPYIVDDPIGDPGRMPTTGRKASEPDPPSATPTAPDCLPTPT